MSFSDDVIGHWLVPMRDWPDGVRNLWAEVQRLRHHGVPAPSPEFDPWHGAYDVEPAEAPEPPALYHRVSIPRSEVHGTACLWPTWEGDR